MTTAGTYLATVLHALTGKDTHTLTDSNEVDQIVLAHVCTQVSQVHEVALQNSGLHHSSK